MARDWASLRYRILGAVEVREGDRVVPVGGTKRRTLLAALLMRPNQVIADDELIDRIWGERPPAEARAQLQVHVSQLRSLLGKATITRRPPGYLIVTRVGEIDRERSELLLAAARADRSAGRTESAAVALREATALWTGPALGGVEPALAAVARPTLEELRAAVVEERYDAELATGRHTEVVGELRELLAESPTRERLAGQLMLALHRSGRTPESLEVYAALRARLVEELGIEPGEALRDLHQRVLCSEVQPFEPSAPDGAASTAPAPVRPAELPHAVRGFVDRRAELDLLDTARSTPDHDGPWIWVVSGPAGVGKTALALHWAHAAAADFPDGQLYLDLRGFDARHAPTEPATALRALLHSLGADLRALPADVDGLARLYRSRLSGLKVCVLLDNAASADQVRSLLPGGYAGTVVLVTSRRQLVGLTVHDGARPIRLGPLRPERSVELLEHLLGADAVAFQRPAAGELAEACGHYPLALRLAAANVITEEARPDIGAMVRALRTEDGLSGLSLGDGESAIATAFALSYRSLSVRHARLFRRLGLIPGATFTAHAAAALDGCEPAEAAAGLRVLVDNHLVERHRADRYRFHDLIRRYAADRARTDDGQDTREDALSRLLDHVQHSATAAARFIDAGDVRLEAEPAADGDARALVFDRREEALGWLRTELPAITALVTAETRAEHASAVWRTADAMRPFLRLGEHPAEWLRIAGAGLAAARGSGDERAVAAMHLSLGLAYLDVGPVDSAARHLNLAARSGEASEWDAGTVEALTALALAHQRRGKLHDALSVAERALGVNQRLGRRQGMAVLHACLGASHGWMGRLVEARTHLTTATDYCQETGSDHARGLALLELGWVRRTLGDTDGAVRQYHDGLRYLRRVTAQPPQALALAGLSQVYCDLGRHDQAAAHAEAALRLARATAVPWVESAALNAMARVLLSVDRGSEAHTLYGRVLRTDPGVGMHWHTVEARIGLATAAARLGRVHEGLADGQRAQDTAREHGYLLLEGWAAERLGDIHTLVGDTARAHACYRTALDVFTATGHVPGEHRLRRVFASTAV